MKKLMLLFGTIACFFVSRAQISDEERKTAIDLLQKNKTNAGLSQTELDQSIVVNTYIIPGSDIRMIYLQQGFRDIPVYNQLNVLAFRNEKIVSNAGSRITGLNQKLAAVNHQPVTTSSIAVKAALDECKLKTSRTITPLKSSGNGQYSEFGNLDVSIENITAELIWFPLSDRDDVKLTWQIFIAPRIGTDYWLIRVDADNGLVIGKESLTVYCNWNKDGHSIEEHLNKHAIPKKTDDLVLNLGKVDNGKMMNSPFVVNNASYRIIPYPAESPIHTGGANLLINNPWTMAAGNATSLGWHNDGSSYFDYTRGNNVYAYEDRDANNLAGLSPYSSTAQPNLTFNFTPDYTQDPVITSPVPNQQFNTTNLFYWNNLVHDLSYIYGFTETARNFQNNNQGRGGLGLDFVIAEAQDGLGYNNAFFSSSPEGSRPRMQMLLWNAATPYRDGDVDNGIIVHEYTHGISNRMTGSGSGCLSNAEQMGEGWSDYFALMMTHNWATATSMDGFNNPRGIGTYALNQPATGPGIRQYKYTTNMSINPLTYANLPGVAHPHGTGTIWATVLWDMTWEIIQMAGINPNLHNIAANGGNAIALKLVTEGLRLQPCSPGFIDGRNAIMKADTLFFGAQYSCAIMNAFARRGMGLGASQGSSNSRNDQTVSFIACTSSVCNPPAGLATSTIYPNSVKVNWSVVSGAYSYDVDYKAAASGTWINAASGISTTFTNIYGLTPATLYDWRVRANCTGSSTYSQAQFTTTSLPCNPPAGLNTTSITTNSASVNWTAVSGAISYTVDYKSAASYTWINAATGTTVTSVNLSGLYQSTLYDWRVRVTCSSGSSIYSQAQFTTASPPPCPGVYDISTNGTLSGAAIIPLNTDIKGTISAAGDKDHYKFHITTGGTVTITLTTLPANYQLDLLSSTGLRLISSANTGSSNETINTTLAMGDYYAKVYPSGSAYNSTSCYTLKVATGTASFGGQEIIVDGSIHVSPNPVSKMITVSIPGIKGQADIRVFDMQGKMLLQKNSNLEKTQLDMATIFPGIYVVKVTIDGKESSIKIVKE